MDQLLQNITDFYGLQATSDDVSGGMDNNFSKKGRYKDDALPDEVTCFEDTSSTKVLDKEVHPREKEKIDSPSRIVDQYQLCECP